MHHKSYTNPQFLQALSIKEFSTNRPPLNLCDPQLNIGEVISVGAGSAKVRMASVNITRDSSSSVSASVGDYLIIENTEYGLFCQISDLRQEEFYRSGVKEIGSVAVVNFLSSIKLDGMQVVPGIEKYPFVGCFAYATHSAIVQAVAEAKLAGKADLSVYFDLAKIEDRYKTPFKVIPEQLFGRHLGLVGASGGGKSWTVAKVLEEACKHHSKAILLDATGEYSSLSGPVTHVYIGDNPNPPKGSAEVVLPYYQLLESDLFAIFKPSGAAQAPKLRAAIKSLKLVNLEEDLGPDGTILKANRHKGMFQRAYEKHYDKVESESPEFDINKLVRQITNECVNENRSPLETDYWGETNSMELAYTVPMVNRISDILNSPSLDPIFKPSGKYSLINMIEWFLGHPTSKLLVISLQYLSFAHSAREIVANSVGRYLMELARDGRFIDRPLLVAVDEAHQFLNTKLSSGDDEYTLDSFALIAKEARKYCMNMILATQRPRDIPEGVFSQLGTLMCHRLTNGLDRQLVERACSEIDDSTIGSLPSLAPGQAVLLGIDFPIPMKVRVIPPNRKPVSRGSDFQSHWSRKMDEDEGDQELSTE